MNIFKKIREKWHNDLKWQNHFEHRDIEQRIDNFEEEVRQVRAQHNDILARKANVTDTDKIKEMISFNCNELIKVRDGMIRMTPRRSIKICFDILEECNLNCKGCLVFSPCAKKAPGYVMSLESFESDVRRLSELFTEEEIEVMTISGGEPLMHKNLLQFPLIIRKYFKSVPVRIVTNGVLLLNMSETFWQMCRENNVSIEQTRYPIDLDFDGIRKKMKAEGIRYIFMDATAEKPRVLQRFPIYVGGVSEEHINADDGRLNFFSCWEANECIRLQEGRFYTCSRIPHMKLFNDCYKEELGENAVWPAETDSISIYEVQNKEQIYEFLSKPTSFCRHCRVKGITDGHPWERSEYQMSEWTDE